jgi:hypothetical protein
MTMGFDLALGWFATKVANDQPINRYFVEYGNI